MSLCVIPARGNSKRILRKNIKEFCGKPIIVWSIEAAKQSVCFNRIVVSTDDLEIKKIAVDYGAEVPFLRPAELSDDFTGTSAVMAHAIKETLGDDFQHNSLVCCLYATAPFTKPLDILEGERLLKINEDCDFAFSVATFPFPIQRALSISRNEKISMFSPEHINTRSQDLEEAWHDAGQFYWGRASAWISEKPIFLSKSTVVKLPRYRVQDIDTEEDWIRAEYLYKMIRFESN